MKYKKILVTGGSGYIGSALTNKLYELGHDVRNYDLVNGCDVNNLDRLDWSMQDRTVVYHLAAVPGVQQCESHPLSAYTVNTAGTAVVAHCAVHHDAKLIFASSFACMQPKNIYGWSKYAAEQIVRSMDGLVVRISNVFGGDHYLRRKDSVVARLMRGTFEERGHGSEMRDFIHLDEVVDGLVELMDAPMMVNNLPYSLNTGVLTSINELIEMKHSKPDDFPAQLHRKRLPFLAL